MIQAETKLRTGDNSGARRIKCFKILKGSFFKEGAISDNIIVSIQRIIPKKKVKKGAVMHAIIILTLKTLYRLTGFNLKFSKNLAIIIDSSGIPIASRVLVPVTYELRKTKSIKILALSSRIF